MKLSLNNFLYGVKQIVTGDNVVDGGFLRDVPVPLAALDLNTAINYDGSAVGAAVATLSGAYLAADEINARVVKVDAATDSIGHLTIPVPRDYDEALDTLKVRVLASQVAVSTDNDVELDSEVYVKTAGSALGPDLNPTAPGTVLSTTEQWIEFDLSGNSLDRDDVVNFELITNGANDTASEEVLIHAVEYVYRSTLVSYDETNAAGTALR